jgi:hypothetical protein
MITIIGKCYQNCKHTVGGDPIPEAVRLEIEGVVKEPLWYHKRGLMQTSTGYGRKLRTEYVVIIDGRRHRVYSSCFSNVSTQYIIKNGKHVTIDMDDIV